MELFNSVKANKRKSYMIIVLVMGLLAAALYALIGMYIGYTDKLIVIVAVSIGLITMVSYLGLTEAVLGINGAVPLSAENSDLNDILEGLCIAAGMPVPKLYQINDSAMNAFATGKNPKNGYICLTTGLINALERDEIEAVMAHELSHIKNYDTLFATVLALYVGIIVFIGNKTRSYNFRHFSCGCAKQRYCRKCRCGNVIFFSTFGRNGNLLMARVSFGNSSRNSQCNYKKCQ